MVTKKTATAKGKAKPSAANKPVAVRKSRKTLRTVRTIEKSKALFLGALAGSASMTAACETSHIPRSTAYDWRAADPAFAAAWDVAIEKGTDALEDEAIRRAHQGVDKPVYQRKELVGHIREYSDTLLIFMLKARRPDKFKERTQVDSKVDVTHRSESVSATAGWLAETLGLGTDSEAPKPLSH